MTPYPILAALLLSAALPALEYAHKPADPQPTGWPLTAEEKVFIAKPEHERRPGSEINQHLPHLWPAVPSAGSWGGTSWVDTHAKLVTYVQANPGPCDVLLVGDSITQQWGSPLDKGVLNAAWLKAFPGAKTINIGIGVDDSIHYIHRFREEFKQDENFWMSIRRCHNSIARAMFYTSVTVVLGFSILALSNFIPTIYFGVLSGLAMITALIANLMLLPLLIVRFKLS